MWGDRCTEAAMHRGHDSLALSTILNPPDYSHTSALRAGRLMRHAKQFVPRQIIPLGRTAATPTWMSARRGSKRSCIPGSPGKSSSGKLSPNKFSSGKISSDIINLTDEGYLMSPEYNNLSDFMVDDLEELSEIIRQAEAEETKHSAPAPIPSTADVVKRADPVQPSSQTTLEHTKDATRPPVQMLHSSAHGKKRWRRPRSSSSDSDGRPSVSRNGRKTAKRPRKCTHSFKCMTCQRERQEIHLLIGTTLRTMSDILFVMGLGD
ncbi:hypothetical protein ABVT39_024598 [Epinephelus coioides]